MWYVSRCAHFLKARSISAVCHDKVALTASNVSRGRNRFLALFDLQANALGRAGQWRLVLDLLDEMAADGNPPTEVALKAAVDCCAKVSGM